ncbi:hypothetical protein SJI19_10590 [Acerihabitans sp. TG2]|uniref:hypothetical protein n=1 Tax=Acerihabitans sp. TG2 TaxID=3096008 RepID=UPI002B2344E5|nr:hypothetical protein [Acerihabitans sp. TG2]MEA9390987.1 hypothetical protein [Acerihabitans sp. TG2]
MKKTIIILLTVTTLPSMADENISAIKPITLVAVKNDSEQYISICNVADNKCGIETKIWQEKGLNDVFYLTNSSLEPVEAALNFDIHEWWHPTAANYFSRISKDQLVGELESAGQSGKARDAEKMKRKDTAEFAESVLEGSGWIPVCMTRIEPQPGIEAIENTTDYPSSADAA